MRFEHTIDIGAHPTTVWAVMSNLPSWPEWTGTVTSLDCVEGDAPRVGAKARVALRGAPAGVWTVTDVQEGRSFTWELRSRGVYTVAGHVIEPREGGSHVTLWIEQTGFVASLLKPYIARVSKRNLPLEAAGLKRASEARPHAEVSS